MRLLGVRLQQAGLSFMSAKARHRSDGMRIDEIVCKTPSDAAAVTEWAAREGHPVEARVAAAEEIEQWEKFQE